MKLYNCKSKEELKLKGIDLESLTLKELQELAEGIYTMFNIGILKDENIAIAGIHQINIELLRRYRRNKR